MNVNSPAKTDPILRLLALVVAVGAGFGAFVELIIVLLQLDEGVCGYFAESSCEDLPFTFDAFLSLLGLGLSTTVVLAGLACAVTGLRAFWRATLLSLIPAGVVGLILYLGHVPYD